MILVRMCNSYTLYAFCMCYTNYVDKYACVGFVIVGMSLFRPFDFFFVAPAFKNLARKYICSLL